MHDDEALTDGSGSDPLSTISRGRRRGVKVTAAAIMALGLAVGGGRRGLEWSRGFPPQSG